MWISELHCLHYGFVTANADELVVIQNGKNVDNFEQISNENEVLSLQCLGHIFSGVLELMWIVEEDGKSPVVLKEGPRDNSLAVAYQDNVANLTIRNHRTFDKASLKCRSAARNNQVTVFVKASKSGHYTNVFTT